MQYFIYAKVQQTVLQVEDKYKVVFGLADNILIRNC